MQPAVEEDTIGCPVSPRATLYISSIYTVTSDAASLGRKRRGKRADVEFFDEPLRVLVHSPSTTIDQRNDNAR